MLIVAVLATTTALATLEEDALGGTYTIYSCDTSPPDGVKASNDPFASAFPEPLAFSTRGMLSTQSGRRCSPGQGTRGLVTMNFYKKGGTVPRRTRAQYAVRAPDKTHFTSLSWKGSTMRRDCRWTLQVYTRGPAGGNVAIRNKRGVKDDCRGPQQGRMSGLQRLYPIRGVEGATKFVQRVFCEGNQRSKRCSNRRPVFARTTGLTVTIADSTPPGVGILADTPFTQGAWTSSSEPAVNYDAGDNVGVKTVQALVDGVESGNHDRDCNFRGMNGLTPCPNGRGSVAVTTAQAAEGTHQLSLVATDSAGNAAASGNAVTVRLDRTPPGAVPVGVAGGEGWRSGNDFDLSWQNPDEGDRAPITAAKYKLCPAAGGQCITGERGGAGIAQIADLAVPAEGEWQLQMWRADAAGNEQPANASQPVALRFDASAPELGFEAVSAEDPTKLAVQVNDRVSGLAGGQIEISQQGSGSWQQLPTAAEGSRLVARVDDARLPAGVYQVRAFARDHAGNQASNDRRLDGQPMVIQVPLRGQSALQAGVAKKRAVIKRVRRGGKRRRVRRRVTVLRRKARVAFGRRVDIVGRLAVGGGAIAGAQVQVYSTTGGGPEQLISTVTTGRRGGYRYRTRGTASRTLRFVYPGTAQLLPAQREVRLLVPAASSFAVRPRRALNGRAIRFRGRLRAPAASKLVELQVVLSGRWQTFRTLRTGPNGGWRSRYRFRRTCGLTRYRFRARLPKEASYPYETGRTRAVRVRVRGRPCR